MAIVIGSGGGESTIPVGPRSDLAQMYKQNQESQKNDAYQMLNMFKQFADAQGISMSHIAEMYPEQMSYAFDILNPGSGEKMMLDIRNMRPNYEQETRFREMQQVGQNMPLVDFYQQQVPVQAEGTTLDESLLDSYESITGDVHSPALVGSKENIANAPVSDMSFGDVIKVLNTIIGNPAADNLPDFMSVSGTSMPSFQNGSMLGMPSGLQQYAQKSQSNEEGWEKIPARTLQTEQGTWEVNENMAPSVEGGEVFIYARKIQEQESTPENRPVEGPKLQRNPAQSPYSEIRGDQYAGGNYEYTPGVGLTQQGLTYRGDRLTQSPTGPDRDLTGGAPLTRMGAQEPISSAVTPPATQETPVVNEQEVQQKRAEVFQKGKAEKPEEVETALEAFGFFPNMERWERQIAEIAPAVAQFLPAAKYYADQAAAQDDPMSMLEIQKLSAEIDKLRAQEYQAYASGDLDAVRRAGEEISNLYIGDKVQTNIRSAEATALANYALAGLRNAQTINEQIEADEGPYRIQQMALEIEQAAQDLITDVDPAMQQNLDTLREMNKQFAQITNPREQRRWLRTQSEAYANIVKALEPAIMGGTTEYRQGAGPGGMRFTYPSYGINQERPSVDQAAQQYSTEEALGGMD